MSELPPLHASPTFHRALVSDVVALIVQSNGVGGSDDENDTNIHSHGFLHGFVHALDVTSNVCTQGHAPISVRSPRHVVTVIVHE